LGCKGPKHDKPERGLATASGESYAAAWCSQNAARVAGFYSLDGSLRVNADPPAVGRDAIAGVVQGFMAAFPDMNVITDDIAIDGDQAVYRWTLVGTNTGPGGTGNGFTSAVLKSGGSEQTDTLPSHAAISTVQSTNVNSNRASMEPPRQPSVNCTGSKLLQTGVADVEDVEELFSGCFDERSSLVSRMPVAVAADNTALVPFSTPTCCFRQLRIVHRDCSNLKDYFGSAGGRGHDFYEVLPVPCVLANTGP
jgi:hypothetical protein